MAQSKNKLSSNTESTLNIIPLIDLTSLNNEDKPDTIINLCKKAITKFGEVATVCIYPKFIPLAVKTLKNTSVKIATVVNFPSGDSTMEDVLKEINSALNDGADEIDMVFPYKTYVSGNEKNAISLVESAKKICPSPHKLKIIIETGELATPSLIKAISTDAIRAGADFIKTSTGKAKQGATLEAATIILEAIKEQSQTSQRPVGIKISGGVRTIEQAESYINLACKIMGNTWVKPDVFRIGASKLLDEIIARLNLGS